jgi:hypothetical protein
MVVSVTLCGDFKRSFPWAVEKVPLAVKRYSCYHKKKHYKHKIPMSNSINPLIGNVIDFRRQ